MALSVVSLSGVDGRLVIFSTADCHRLGSSPLVPVAELAGALRAVAASQDLVAFVEDDSEHSVSQIGNLIAILEGEQVDGVAVGLPATDSLKRVRNGMVVESVDRTAVLAVGMPQVVRRDHLVQMLDAGSDREHIDPVADLAGLGVRVSLVETV